MTNIAIRQKLHNYLEVVDDKKLEAIYTIMEHEIEESATTYTDEFKAELIKRYSEYKNGNVKMIDTEESKKRVEVLLSKGRK